ncbi:MlaD family protein [Patulibacter defluvii]|uniref:MlaD family protein n=1 Tax=Patulibacter defluvii TaxID=3095358 RepID=UPI002A76421B|nr:MlaD family protein [Patulibacter sp. DM4]
MTVLRRNRTVALGAATIGIVALLLLLAFSGTLNRLQQGGGRTTIRVQLADAQQLRAGDKVRIQGVDVGRVERIERDRGARTATASLALDDDAGPIYGDASVAIRFRTLLGAAFFVDLDRGRATAGPLGSRGIPASRSSNQVELEQITSIVQGDARRGLQTLAGELATTFTDTDSPGRAVDALADVAPDVRRGIGALRGLEPGRDVPELVRNAERAMRALNQSSEQLRTLVAAGARTLETVAGRQADLRATLDRAPRTLADTDRTLVRLDGTLRTANPLLDELRVGAGDVAPTVRALRPTVVRADRLVHRAVPLVRALRPASTALAHTARDGVPLLNDLQPSVDRLDRTILPYLDEVDPETQHSTAQMIGPTFVGVGSGAAGQEDGNGRFIRFPLTTGNNFLYLPCQLMINDPSAKKLLECQSLEGLLNQVLSYDPTKPPAGSSENPGPGR